MESTSWRAMVGREDTLIHEGLPDRDWPEVLQARSVVESECGPLLDELMELRDKARDDLYGFDADSLRVVRQVDLVVRGIYSRAIIYLDCVRVLAERGYGEEALGLARSIYESEVDAYLLFAKPCLLDRYTDFEVYQRCLFAARLESAGGELFGYDLGEFVEPWRQKLRGLAQQRGLDLPPDFADAVRAFSRKRFGSKSPGSWRFGMQWKRDILPVVVEAYERIAAAS